RVLPPTSPPREAGFAGTPGRGTPSPGFAGYSPRHPHPAKQASRGPRVAGPPPPASPGTPPTSRGRVGLPRLRRVLPRLRGTPSPGFAGERALLARIGYHGHHASDRSRSADLNDWFRSGDYDDIWYDTIDGIAKITINRPHVRNAFRPRTLFELSHAFNVARDDPRVGVVILTGAGTEAFCSGGDQKVRGDDG